MTFLNSERLRMVLYNLGGPAIDIPNSPRVDWLSYRLGGLRSFFAGNIYYYEGQPGAGNIIETAVIEEPVYPYYWLYFFILVLVVVLVSILLLRMRGPDAARRRSRNYLAVSYLLRVAIIIPGALFMYGVSGVAFPFEPFSLMDILVLWLLFSEQGAGKELRRKTGEA